MNKKKYKRLSISEAINEVSNDGCLLKCFSDEIKNNKDVVLAAVFNYGLALENASSELKNDREVVVVAINNNTACLNFASDEIRNNKEIALIAVSKNGLSLQYLSENIKNDYDVVKAAVTQYGESLYYASDDLKNDKEIVKIAVSHHKALEYPNRVLKYASSEIRDNFDVVLNSVIYDANSLQFASERLKNNKEIAFEAINNNQNGEALYFVSKDLKNDYNVVLAAINKNKDAISFASEYMINNVSILEAFFNNFPLESYNNHNFYKELQIKYELLKQQELLEKTIPINQVKVKAKKF